MKDKACIFSIKPANPIEMFPNENNLDEPQDTELKGQS